MPYIYIYAHITQLSLDETIRRRTRRVSYWGAKRPTSSGKRHWGEAINHRALFPFISQKKEATSLWAATYGCAFPLIYLWISKKKYRLAGPSEWTGNGQKEKRPPLVTSPMDRLCKMKPFFFTSLVLKRCPLLHSTILITGHWSVRCRLWYNLGI